jgi:hypothetical protein
MQVDGESHFLVWFLGKGPRGLNANLNIRRFPS